MRRHLGTLVTFALGFASAAALAPAFATTAEESPYFLLGQMSRVLVEVERHYVEPVDRAKLVEGAITGMVSELDPHSSYMNRDEYALLRSETEGQFGGIGVEVEPQNDALLVLAPIEGSPAERAGIQSGDRIVAVDGEEITGQGLDKLVRRLRGAPQSRVKLTIARPGAREPLTFELVREIIKVPSVFASVLEGGIAYVRIKQFQERTHEELVREGRRIRAEGALQGVLLDMRNDPGGLVDEAADVADEFLAAGSIFSMRHRGRVLEEVSAGGGGLFAEAPVVILVNGWTASAAELVTGALQDHGRAFVVGGDTFGKGSVQSIIELPGGAGMKLTTARYYTPHGRAIQAEGIHPDLVVHAPGDAGRQLRERDLRHHLAGEKESVDAGISRAAPAGTASDAGPPPKPVMGRDVPRDPSKSADPVLRAGYDVLRTRFVGKGPRVR